MPEARFQCLVCQRWVVRSRKAGPPPVYCSRACRGWWREFDMRARRSIALWNRPCKTCERPVYERGSGNPILGQAGKVGGGNALYCSRECREFDIGDRNVIHDRCKVPWRVCKHCGETFIARAKRSTCSVCRYLHQRAFENEKAARRRARQRPEKTCLMCDVKLPRSGMRYCSENCKLNYGASSPIRYCEVCGAVFAPPGKTCGEACWRIRERERLARYRPLPARRLVLQCQWCGDFFQTIYPNQLGCCRMHSKYLARQRRKMVKRGAFVEQVMRAKVFERDGWICQICGEPVDRQVQWPDDRAPTLDHIQPLSKGGHHSYDNCQTAHFLCNSVKSDAWAA